MIPPDYARLDAAGLNLHAVLAIGQLPDELRNSLEPYGKYRQLILIGNGGPRLWATIQAEEIASADPIDDFSVRQVAAWLAQEAPGCRQQIVYPGIFPGQRAIGLQSLGRLAGWHFASPFMVGINARWGTWHAYRAVVLADTDFAPSVPEVGESPCESCRERVCVDACPATAMIDGRFDLQSCVDYRRQPESACRATCLARLACPVGGEQRYSGEQIRHSYSISLRMIERYY